MLIPVSLAAPAVRLELTVGDLGNLRRSYRRGYGAPSWTRTNIVGLEGRLPVRRPGRTGAGERRRTVPCLVGNDAAHHARPRDWELLQDLHLLPPTYQVGAHLHELGSYRLVGVAGFEPAISCARGTCSSPG